MEVKKTETGRKRRGRPKGRKSTKAETMKISPDKLLYPQSPLVSMDLRELINPNAFSQLTSNQQFELMEFLPSCDIEIDESGIPKLNRDSLTNEFIKRALAEFPARIQEGEFTRAFQARLTKNSGDPNTSQIPPWKERFFEAEWGDLLKPDDNEEANQTNHTIPNNLETIVPDQLNQSDITTQESEITISEEEEGNNSTKSSLVVDLTNGEYSADSNQKHSEIKINVVQVRNAMNSILGILATQNDEILLDKIPASRGDLDIKSQDDLIMEYLTKAKNLIQTSIDWTASTNSNISSCSDTCDLLARIAAVLATSSTHNESN